MINNHSPSYGVSNGPTTRAWILVILSGSGATNIPGGGSLNILKISLIKKKRIFLYLIKNKNLPFDPCQTSCTWLLDIPISTM
jgi:hypothetical protein